MDKPNVDKIIFSVDEYLEFANVLLSQARVAVEGEIIKIDRRDRYTFFTLSGQDGKGILPCFMWNYVLDKTEVKLQSGIQIQVLGHGAVFPKRGSFSFDVELIEIKGEGLLNEAFIQMKNRLEKEGFFDEGNKRTLPPYISKVGLITSRHGQAIHDFLTHLGSWGIEIYHKHVMVEGIYAIESIVNAIKDLNEYYANELDVIVITRGGGSLESLQAFNSELIARAIRASRIPIISAIGHHTDITIADLSSDYTCSTPTHAGSFIARDWENSREKITVWKRNWQNTLMMSFENEERKLIFHQQQIGAIPKLLENIVLVMENKFKNSMRQITAEVELVAIKAKEFVNKANRKIDQILFTHQSAIEKKSIVLSQVGYKNIKHLNTIVDLIAKSIQSQNPISRLAQGYVIMKSLEGKIIGKSVSLSSGQQVNVLFTDGERLLKSTN